MKPTPMIRSLLIVLGLTTIAATSVSAQESPSETDIQTIYPVDAFMQEWEIDDIALSPNGQYLAITSPYRDQIVLIIGHFVGDQFKIIKPIPFERDRYPINVLWATNERLVFTVRSKVKVARTRIYTWSEVLASVNADGTEFQLLRTDGGRGSQRLKHIDNSDVINVLRDEPDNILVGKSRKRNWIDEYKFGAIDDVYKLNIRSGDLDLYMRGPSINRFKFYDWYADYSGHIRLGYGYDRKGDSVIIIRGRGDEDWTVLSDNELFEEGKFLPLQFGSAPNEFYVLSSLATGRMAVYQFDIATGVLGDLVYEHDRVDVTGIVYSHDRGKVVAARYNENGPRLQYLDDDYGSVRDRIGNALETGFSILSISDDDDFMLVVAGDERDAGTFYFYDVPEKRLKMIGSRISPLNPLQLSNMESVYYETRDGLEINAVLTKPRLHDGEPLPFIILPHSNPNSRDSVEWDRRVQFLTNRGYGVFQPNYRGSSGFGQRFRALGEGEWGRDMQNDLIDGIEWLIDEGHTQPGQICIVGREYAGYAALLAVAQETDLFSCAIARDAPVDLARMLMNQKAFDEDSDDYIEIVGDMKKKELDRISPLERVSDIKAPILLYHREDSYYNVKNVRRFVRALSKSKKTFDYLEIEESKGEDLYDGNEDDKRFWALAEAWLLKVQPTPLLQRAAEEGKVSGLPEMTDSRR